MGRPFFDHKDPISIRDWVPFWLQLERESQSNIKKETVSFRETVSRIHLTTTISLLLRPNTSGEYISSALAGGTTKVPGVVALAT